MSKTSRSHRGPRTRFPKGRFPWKIFLRLILGQALFILSLFLIAGSLGRQAVREDLLSHYDEIFLFSGLALAVVLAVFSGLLAKRLLFPIGRMILKTKSVLQPGENPDLDRGDLGQEENDEWSELESSIDDIRRDLERKVESLRTEREEQATLMGAISDAILAVGLDESPLFYNTRFAVLFGNPRSGTRLWEIIRTPEVLEAFQKALKQGQSEIANTLPLEQPTGRRFLSLAVSPLRDSKGNIYGAVGVFHDVTDLKLAEQIRIDFVANVSHELRTPLTAIKGYAETLKTDVDAGKPATPEFLEIIIRNTRRLMNLIEDLLDLSALESTSISDVTEISTDEATQRVLQQMAASFSAKNQKVKVEYQSHSVAADPKRLEQVLINLLDNANKYTPEGGTISIRWDMTPEKGTLLEISDSGPGIPLEHQRRLFERFYRVDQARSREKGGTGLGLAIVKHILQKHGGTVAVQSFPEKGEPGSKFVCQFPPIQIEFRPKG